MRKGIAVAIVAALAAAAVYLAVGWKNGAKSPPYRTEPVVRGPISETVLATGTVNAVTTVSVGSQVSGTVQRIFVDFNSRVRKGDRIARIDPRLFEAALLQARGALEGARAALERAEVQVIDTERTLRRNRELVRDGFVAQADVDAAQTAYETALAQKKSAQAQLLQAEGAVSSAETNLRYTDIRSPVDGIVISRNVDAGQTVAASFQTPTLFLIAEDLTKMQIDTNVDESDIARVRRDLPATFTVDAWPGRSFEGRVVQVRNSPIVTQNVVTYNVVVRVDNRDLALRPGMTANVSIRVRTLDNVLKIPNAALRYRPSDAKKETGRGKGEVRGARVYRLGTDRKPQAVPVKTGIRDETFSQLLEGDLKEGDPLVVEELRRGNGGAGRSGPRMRFF
ncbi:MAG: efflux RND transporter periplasmic adaptor subunit [Deltaproteobacteria bacterium]